LGWCKLGLRDWETGIERGARERVDCVKMPKTKPPGLGFRRKNVGRLVLWQWGPGCGGVKQR
jgi:hypothetical protein